MSGNMVKTVEACERIFNFNFIYVYIFGWHSIGSCEHILRDNKNIRNSILKNHRHLDGIHYIIPNGIW